MIIKKVLHKISFEIERAKNMCHAYDFSEVNDGWIKYSAPVIESNNQTLYDPFVCFENGIVYMFVSNRDKRTIDRYQSKDCIEWYNKKTILHSMYNGKWNDRINRLCAMRFEDQWYIWYTGQYGKQSTIGFCKSPDKNTFIQRDHPIMIPEKAFEGKSIMNPCVIWDENELLFKMWYSAGEQYEPDVICYATSSNGIDWEKREHPVLEKSSYEYDRYKVGGCDVHKSNDGYVMYYIGYQNLDTARICKALSKDGIHWNRSKNNPIVSPTRNGWDRDACYKPSYYYSEGMNKSFIFYNGRKRHSEAIGFVYKDGKDF